MPCKQVEILSSVCWDRDSTVACSLGHGHTHSHIHRGRVFVPALYSMVYFWGDKKMIKAMWPDCRNDLLTVSGVSYYTRKYTHTPIFLYTVTLTCMTQGSSNRSDKYIQLLQGHHRERADQQHLSVAWELHRHGQKGPKDSGEECRDD